MRDSVDRGSIDAPEALRRYTQVVEAGLGLARALIRPSTEDLLREAQALMTLSEARELLARAVEIWTELHEHPHRLALAQAALAELDALPDP